MNFKYKLLFLTCSLSISIGQEVIPFDVSNQFAVPLSNNQLAWNTDLSFNKLLIDRSSKNFRQKFTNLTFEELPNDSTYVKSKFIYEFGDYGFDKLSVGLKKHSKDNNFEFIGMKKSFFGQKPAQKLAIILVTPSTLLLLPLTYLAATTILLTISTNPQ